MLVEEILNEIANELQQISMNTTNPVFDSSSFISTLLGAIVAAALGIITTLIFDFRQNRGNKQIAINMIYGELTTALDFIKRSREVNTSSTTDLTYNKIINNEYLIKHRADITNIIDETNLKNIIIAYDSFKILDDLMDKANKYHDLSLLNPDKHNIEEEFLSHVKTYWRIITNDQTKNIIKEAENALEILRSKI